MGEPADGLGVDCRPDEGPEDAIRLCRGGSRLLREPRYVLLVRSFVCVLEADTRCVLYAGFAYEVVDSTQYQPTQADKNYGDNFKYITENKLDPF